MCKKVLKMFKIWISMQSKWNRTNFKNYRLKITVTALSAIKDRIYIGVTTTCGMQEKKLFKFRFVLRMNRET